MTAVMLSIRPEWCALIAQGKKTIEVRKNRPKLETPFKCYIYETLGKSYRRKVFTGEYLRSSEGRGRVIGEFVCDTFVTDKTFGHDPLFNASVGLSEADAAAYATNCPLYGWHISDLVIYDDPKKLSEFNRYSEDYDRPCEKGEVCEHEYFDYSEDCKACRVDFDGENCPKRKLQRPPQSWCYVEEVTE